MWEQTLGSRLWTTPTKSTRFFSPQTSNPLTIFVNSLILFWNRPAEGTSCSYLPSPVRPASALEQSTQPQKARVTDFLIGWKKPMYSFYLPFNFYFCFCSCHYSSHPESGLWVGKRQHQNQLRSAVVHPNITHGACKYSLCFFFHGLVCSFYRAPFVELVAIISCSLTRSLWKRSSIKLLFTGLGSPRKCRPWWRSFASLQPLISLDKSFPSTEEWLQTDSIPNEHPFERWKQSRFLV